MAKFERYFSREDPLKLEPKSGKKLVEMTAGLLQFLQGNESVEGKQVAPPLNPPPESILFVSEPTQVESALNHGTIIVASEKLAPKDWKLPNPQTQVLYQTAQVKRAMARTLAGFDRPGSRPAPGVHPSAVVHHTAQVGAHVTVEALVVVGEGVVIGDGCWLQAGSIIEPFAFVGGGTRVQSRAVVGAYCEIGANCQLGPGTVIGSDGFGFVEGNPPEKVPQIGKVVIGDAVEFGANCAVDRGTMGETRIGSGTKFDNLCHVAHNCEIGKNGLFAGGFFVAGSSKIGDYFMCGGAVVVADHVTITDKVILGGKAVVTKDIKESGAYTGYPLEPIKDGLKTVASLPAVKELREKVRVLEERMDGLSK